MKKCPYCAEEIQDDAIKCKHCGEFLNKQAQKWYFKTYALVIALLLMGPFALSMVWPNPNYSRTKKIVITIIVLAITLVLIVVLVWLVITYFNMIGNLFINK